MKVLLDTHFLIWLLQGGARLLAAHSQLRRVPLCTTDRVLRRHHLHLVDELDRAA